jgi:hypothetical protein
MEKPSPVCATCNDSHRMEIRGREVACTSCPLPCEACRFGGGAFCKQTPCACACHSDSFAYRGRGPSYLPAMPSVDLDSSTVAELAAVLKRAGLPPDCIVALRRGAPSSPPKSAGERELLLEMSSIARALAMDAIREERRWTERVKLLEGRIDFAVEVLRGRLVIE